MGWLGWSYDQTMTAPMAAITLAYEGRVDMITTVLEAVFGKRDGANGENGDVKPGDAAAMRAMMARLKAARETTHG